MFSDPPNQKYAWLATELAEKIVLQDLSWKLIWLVGKINFSLLGEGGIVKLASSENQYPSNACTNWDIFMIARSKSKTEYFGKHNSRDTRRSKTIVARRKNMDLSTNVTSKYFFQFILLGDADWYYTDIHIATYLLAEDPLCYFYCNSKVKVKSNV